MSTSEQLFYVLVGIAISFVSVAFVLIIPNLVILDAHAQIEQREIELRQVRDLEECTKKFVSGASAYIPFTLKVWYDTTEDRGAEIIQKARSFPVLQQTPQVMTFHTNYTDQYQLVFNINYDEERKRQVFIQYLSQGRQVQTEQEHYDGTSFCTQFIIHTGIAPKTPTREEMFGDAYRYFGMIPTLIDGFNQNSITVSSSITYMWLIIGGMIIIFIYWIIQSSVDKKKFKSATSNINEFLDSGNELIDNLDGKMKKLDNMTKAIEQNQKNILSFQEKEAESIEKIGEVKDNITKKDSSKITKTVEKPAKEFTSMVKDFTKFVSKSKQETDEPKKEKKRRIEVSNDKVDIKQETKRFSSQEVRERMSNKTMKIIDSINIKTMEASFKDFSYEELNEAYSWVTTKIKSTGEKLRSLTDDDEIKKLQDRLDKMSTIQKVIHAGAQRKWMAEHPEYSEKMHNE